MSVCVFRLKVINELLLYAHISYFCTKSPFCHSLFARGPRFYSSRTLIYSVVLFSDPVCAFFLRQCSVFTRFLFPVETCADLFCIVHIKLSRSTIHMMNERFDLLTIHHTMQINFQWNESCSLQKFWLNCIMLLIVDESEISIIIGFALFCHPQMAEIIFMCVRFARRQTLNFHF